MTQKEMATGTLKRFYNDTWQRSKDEFLMCLRTNMMLGPIRTRHVKMQLNMLKGKGQIGLVDDIEGDSLLHLWANFHRDKYIMTKLLQLVPDMLLCERKGDYKGQNVLHVLVQKQSLSCVKDLLETCSEDQTLGNYKSRLLNGKAVGSSFACTVMMGELPLSVAALTFNLKMMELLMKHGAKLHEVNTKGDTVFHSLLHFAKQYPKKETYVVDMMLKVNEMLQTTADANFSEADPRAVWLLENKEGLTALKMSAKFALPSLFQLILELQGVYCQLDGKDGLLDFLLYDITEIDPMAQQHLSSSPSNHTKVEPLNSGQSPSSQSIKLCENETGIPSTPSDKKSPAIMEIICEIEPAEKAFQILNNYVIRSIVKAKWLYYCKWFFGWLFLHFLFMSLLSMHAIFKAELIRREEESSSNGTASPSTSYGSAAPFSLETAELSRVVMAMSVMMSVPSLMVVVLELARTRFWMYLLCTAGQFTCDCSKISISRTSLILNGMYHPQLVIFALCVLIDSLWYWISGPDNNVFLTLALLMGWWFCRFFLRPFRKFSFFTVMLQKVLMGDLWRFSVVVMLDLLAFSIAMYMTFLVTPGGPPGEFEDLGETLITMFKLLFGLTEIEVLNQASYPWVSIALFVLFILLTYLLMLNALIAMMSNTCSIVAQDRDSQWELQRLSVVLFLEDLLPRSSWKCNTGDRQQNFIRYNLAEKRRINECRYFIKVEQARFTKDTRGQDSMTEANVVDLRVAMMLQLMKDGKHLPTVMKDDRFKQATDRFATADGAGKEKKTPMKEGEIYTYTFLRKHLVDQIKKAEKEDGPYRKSTASTTLPNSGSLMLPASARASKQETDRSSGGRLRRWKSEPMLQVFDIPQPPLATTHH